MDGEFLPTADLATLRARADLLRRIRKFFDSRDFIEVQTPLLSRETVVDVHLDPITVETQAVGLGSPGESLFLQTSPEFAMKRLLAAGAQRIYQVCPAFRAAERGELHNPEFTMLEWYRTGDTMADGVKLLEELVVELTGKRCKQITYQRAFIELAGVDPLSASAGELRECGESLGATFVDSGALSGDEWLNWLLDEVVAPGLGNGEPIVLTHYPVSQAALAKVNPEDPRTAERFELFIDGIELANGYGELLDADELIRRSALNNRQREVLGRQVLPVPRLLEGAMRRGLPNCSGCALGVDRFLQVLLKASHIDQVLSFPADRA